MRANRIFKREEVPYHVKKVNKLVLIIQRSTDKVLVDRCMLELFNCMKKVVEKNTNNYLLLVRNSGLKEGYEVDEITIECYLIMTKCIKKFRVQKGNNFYFYFNKSLSRTLFRLYEKEQKRNVEGFKTNDFDSSSHIMPSKLTNNINLSIEGILLDNLNMSEVEKLICMSKVKEQKREDFLIEFPNVSNNQYYICMKSIKIKLLKLRKNGDI